MAMVEQQRSHKTLQLFDPKETLKAAHALVRHLDNHRDDKRVEKPSLLEDDDEENQKSKLDIPLWLTVNAKERIATSHSLHPGKVVVPHPLYSSAQTRICLITADPPTADPKAYKNLLKHDSFPKDLKEKIVKVVAYSKLAKKHKSFESRRLLMAEYDLFLADQRVVRLLPAALGSTFYKSTTKRPIPVSLTGKENWGRKEKKTALDRLKPKKKGPPLVIGKPVDVAQDIEKAMSTLAIHLSPSMTTSIKVAYAGWPAEWIAENVDAAVERIVTKYVSNQWNGVKSIHLKGPQTAALPIWMADEVWQDEARVLDDGEAPVDTNFKKKTKEEKRQRKEKAKSKKAEAGVAVQETTQKTSKKRKHAEEQQTQTAEKKAKKGKTVTIVENPAAEAGQKAKEQKTKRKRNHATVEEEPVGVEHEKGVKTGKSLGLETAAEQGEEPPVTMDSVVEKHKEPAAEAEKVKKTKKEKTSKVKEPTAVDIPDTKRPQSESRLNFDVANWEWTLKKP